MITLKSISKRNTRWDSERVAINNLIYIIQERLYKTNYQRQTDNLVG